MTDTPPAFGIASPSVLAALTGLEAMQALVAGDLPAAPIAEGLNFRAVSAEQGRVAFRGAPGHDHCNPMGQIHGGWYGAILDSAMGCAVLTMLPAGTGYTTLEYKVNLVRAIPPGTPVEAVAEVDHAGRSTATAHAELRGVSDGRLYATGSTTCLVLRPQG